MDKRMEKISNILKEAGEYEDTFFELLKNKELVQLKILDEYAKGGGHYERNPEFVKARIVEYLVNEKKLGTEESCALTNIIYPFLSNLKKTLDMEMEDIGVKEEMFQDKTLEPTIAKAADQDEVLDKLCRLKKTAEELPAIYVFAVIGIVTTGMALVSGFLVTVSTMVRMCKLLL